VYRIGGIVLGQTAARSISCASLTLRKLNRAQA
jgi:hypothetical protein